jgi:hypothetical protein
MDQTQELTVWRIRCLSLRNPYYLFTRSLREKTLNGKMDTVISILVRILEVMFMVGLAGSAVVLILTSFEDIKSLLPGGEKKETALERAHPAQPQLHTSESHS